MAGAPRVAAPTSASIVGRRAFATSQKQALNFAQSTTTTNTRPAASSIAKSRVVARQFQRAYADAAPKPSQPGKLRKTFKWIWRLTYLSVLGTFVGIGYTIYLDRNPEPQYEPDPSKKTLVVLGMRP